MKKLFLVLGATACLWTAPASAASIDCTSAAVTLASVSGAGNGCNALNGMTFSNFTVTSSSGLGTIPLNYANANNIMVQVIVSPYTPFGVQVRFTNPTDWPFLVTIGNWAVGIQYQADSVTPVSATGAGVNGDFTGTGNTALVKVLSTGPGGAGAFSVVQASQPGAAVGFTTVNPPVTSWWVNDNIQVNAGSGGSGSLNYTTNDFAVPEPVTMSLMGAGLLALGIFGRRSRRR